MANDFSSVKIATLESDFDPRLEEKLISQEGKDVPLPDHIEH